MARCGRTFKGVLSLGRGSAFEDYSSMWLLALGWSRGKQGWALQWDQASSVDGSVVVETLSILNTLCLRSPLAV